MEQEITELGQDWADAERRGDTAFLARTLADDFVGVGPRGFLLTKEQWLARHQSGDLRYTSVTLDEITVRLYGDTAVATARQTSQAQYQGHDTGGQFRITLVFVRPEGHWLLAALHLSPIAPGLSVAPPQIRNALASER